MTNNNQKIYFPGLDAIRSIACLIVLSSHLIWETLEPAIEKISFYETHPYLQEFLQFFFKNGSLGVRIFFVLSGFLITYLIIEEIRKRNSLNLKNFYIRRVLRIWPVYFAVLLFAFVIYPIIKQYVFHVPNISHENPALFALFLSNFDVLRILSTPGQYANGMLSVTWSVSIEEQFYLVWPFLFYFLKRKYLLASLLTIMGVSLIYMFMNSGDLLDIYYNTLPNFIFLSSGGILALLLQYRREQITRIYTNLGPGKLALILLVLLLMLIFPSVAINKSSYKLVIYPIVTAIFCTLWISTQLIAPIKYIDLNSANILIKMGKYTYGLYMYHRIAQWVVVSVMNKATGNSTSVSILTIGIILSLFLSFILSYFSYNYYERWFLRMKDKFAYFSKQ